MSEGVDEERWGGRLVVQPGGGRQRANTAPPEIRFNRSEIDAILKVYGRKVAAGEWRDYAIDHRRDEAVFSIFRRTSEVPLYRIVKQPKLARKQGAYSIVLAGGYILKRGHDLKQVLFALDRGPRLVEA